MNNIKLYVCIVHVYVTHAVYYVSFVLSLSQMYYAVTITYKDTYIKFYSMCVRVCMQTHFLEQKISNE